jgi:hypothetical protein
MRFVTCLCVVSLCIAGLFNSTAMGAHRRVLGTVIQTNLAHLDGSNAAVGADVYSCDALDTDEGGAMRLNVSSSQVYLSTSSVAALEDDGSFIRVLITRGTVGFSESASGEISIRTPAGEVRPAGGQAATGEVTFKGPKELLISAIRGDVILDNGGDLRTIPEGKSADVTFEDNLVEGCHDEAATDQQQQHAYVHHKIGFYIVVGAAVALPSYLIWREESESNTTPSQ